MRRVCLFMCDDDEYSLFSKIEMRDRANASINTYGMWFSFFAFILFSAHCCCYFSMSV